MPEPRITLTDSQCARVAALLAPYVSPDRPQGDQERSATNPSSDDQHATSSESTGLDALGGAA